MERAAHNPELTPADLQRLKQSPEPYSRAAIAGKIGYYFDNAIPDSAPYQLAADIAGYLQKDKAEYVRIALAKNLEHSRTAPKTLILNLANDHEDDVAVPILRSSPLLEDQDLTTLIENNENPVRLMAMAERRFLSVSISGLLVRKRYEKVAHALLGNESAAIDSSSYLYLAEQYLQSPLILQQMMRRNPLPQEAIARMQQAVATQDQENTPPPSENSRKMKSFAPLAHQDSHSVLQYILALKQETNPENYRALAAELYHSGKITISVLLLAIGCGHVGLFYACIAAATGANLEDIGMQDTDQRDRLNALLLKAGISNSLLPLVHWVLQGATLKLEQGVQPCSKQMYKLMSIRMHEGARRGINFAATIGVPVANTLDGLI